MNRFVHNNTATSPATRLAEFVDRYAPVLVLTGAGISTASGIPDYRNDSGEWKRKQPVQHQVFMNDPAARQRYWARSMVGWPVIQNATPNAAHLALAQLESSGLITRIVTQNVDRLHQKAGSHAAIDLHGRADRVICMSCNYTASREEQHARCTEHNPLFRHHTATTAPDGDADLEMDFSRFQVPDCPQCSGILKPDVVFFGDSVPKRRVESVMDTLDRSGALLVVGSSLMVFSGFRFCRQARQWDKPLALLNRGRTRADDIATMKLDTDIGETLAGLSAS